MRALFISEKYIKENSAIDTNTDYKKILPTVWMCQIQYLQAYLGTKVYENLIDEILNDTVSANNEILLKDYVADALLYWVMYEVQIPLLYEFRNKNVSKKSSDNAQPIGTKELSRIENRFKDKAEYFSKRISDYLCANRTIYPLYCTENEIDETLPEQGKASVSVFLGNSTPKTECNKYLY